MQVAGIVLDKDQLLEQPGEVAVLGQLFWHLDGLLGLAQLVPHLIRKLKRLPPQRPHADFEHLPLLEREGGTIGPSRHGFVLLVFVYGQDLDPVGLVRQGCGQVQLEVELVLDCQRFYTLQAFLRV